MQHASELPKPEKSGAMLIRAQGAPRDILSKQTLRKIIKVLQLKVIKINPSYTTFFNRRLIRCLLSLLYHLSGASVAFGINKHSEESQPCQATSELEVLLLGSTYRGAQAQMTTS